jgi:hypothetical protein
MVGWPKLEPWLKRCFFDKHDEGDISRLELRQVVHGDPDAVVQTWSFDEDTKSVVLDELASEIFQTAQADGEEHEGPAKYTVLAYFGGANFPSSRCPAVRVLSSMRSDGDYQETEMPNSRGFATQQMRHNEVLMRMLVSSAAQHSQHTERLLSRAYDRIESLEEERGTFLDAFERLQQGSHERELEARSHDANLKHREEMLEQVKVLVPTVVNKVAGKKLLPEKTTAKDEIVHSLLASLSPEQMAALQGILTPAQLVGFAELYEGEAKKALEKKAAKERGNGSN